MSEQVERELMTLLERPAEQDPPLPEGVFHLMVADSETARSAQSRRGFELVLRNTATS